MPLFSFGKKSKLGIDIGTSSIKVAELSRESGRFKLENYGLFELESEDNALNISGQIGETKIPHLSDQDLAWGIKQILSRGKIKTTDAVASIPSFSTFATVISMPYLSEEDIAKTIPFEARKYVPIPLTDVVLDWSIINVTPPMAQAVPGPEAAAKPPTVEVFLVAVPKDETERYQSIMKRAGLNLRALELENTALIRALIGNDLSPMAVVNIGGRSTSILIVDNGFERVSHTYEVGGFEITKSISRSLGISIKRAEELKKSSGLKEADSSAIVAAMSSLIDLMAFEAKKTVHNYEDLKKVKINKAMLVGGLANMPKFADYFSSKLGFPVTLGNPLARVIYPPALDKIKAEINATFAITLGLAMREI